MPAWRAHLQIYLYVYLFPTENVYVFLFYPVLATRPAYFTLLVRFFFSLSSFIAWPVAYCWMSRGGGVREREREQCRLNFCVSMHHHIWVYWDQLDANCLVLFYYTFFTLHVSDVIHIHPQERHIMHMQPDTGKCACELTRFTPCLASSLEARHGVERINSHVHLPVSDCMCII